MVFLELFFICFFPMVLNGFVMLLSDQLSSRQKQYKIRKLSFQVISVNFPKFTNIHNIRKKVIIIYIYIYNLGKLTNFN